MCELDTFHRAQSHTPPPSVSQGNALNICFRRGTARIHSHSQNNLLSSLSPAFSLYSATSFLLKNGAEVTSRLVTLQGVNLGHLPAKTSLLCQFWCVPLNTRDVPLLNLQRADTDTDLLLKLIHHARFSNSSLVVSPVDGRGFLWESSQPGEAEDTSNHQPQERLCAVTCSLPWLLSRVPAELSKFSLNIFRSTINKQQ